MTVGRFISLEGGEGTGKSTQSKAIVQALEARGLQVCLTREPGGTSGGETIRELLLDGSQDKWGIRSEALLFAAARAEHCRKLIRPAIERGQWVVCDRFIDSSRAYQTTDFGLTDEDILTLHQIGSENYLPDCTIILDLPDDIAVRRAHARDRGNSDRIGGRDREYHAGVMARFREIAVKETKRVKLIDANQSVESVTASIMNELKVLLG